MCCCAAAPRGEGLGCAWCNASPATTHAAARAALQVPQLEWHHVLGAGRVFGPRNPVRRVERTRRRVFHSVRSDLSGNGLTAIKSGTFSNVASMCVRARVAGCAVVACVHVRMRLPSTYCSTLADNAITSIEDGTFVFLESEYVAFRPHTLTRLCVPTRRCAAASRGTITHVRRIGVAVTCRTTSCPHWASTWSRRVW